MAGYENPSAPKPSNAPGLQRSNNGLGAKFKLIHEGDIQVCRLNHNNTLLSKILSSKFLRKWESHHVVLADYHLYSTTVSSFLFSNLHVFNSFPTILREKYWQSLCMFSPAIRSRHEPIQI